MDKPKPTPNEVIKDQPGSEVANSAKPTHKKRKVYWLVGSGVVLILFLIAYYIGNRPIPPEPPPPSPGSDTIDIRPFFPVDDESRWQTEFFHNLSLRFPNSWWSEKNSTQLNIDPLEPGKGLGKSDKRFSFILEIRKNQLFDLQNLQKSLDKFQIEEEKLIEVDGKQGKIITGRYPDITGKLGNQETTLQLGYQERKAIIPYTRDTYIFSDTFSWFNGHEKYFEKILSTFKFVEISTPIPTTFKTVKINTCNVTVKLPVQDTYEPSEFTIESRNEPTRWLIKKTATGSGSQFLGTQTIFDKKVEISNLPGGAARDTIPCGIGCVSESTISIYCNEDSRTSEELIEEFKTVSKSESKVEYIPNIESIYTVNMWGEQVYKIHHGSATDNPERDVYVFSKNGLIYYIDSLGGQENFQQVFNSLRF